MKSSIEIKSWYLSTFPDDIDGEQLYWNITFGEVYFSVICNADVYSLLNTNDAIIVNRILKKMCELLNLNYSDVHTYWCEQTNISQLN
jgi:hypothetical protein